ncbi:hypothetical protein LOD99_16288 [Oopsacas minuta]|uniref:Uncharacterized protein n=1 Tax=Oopsacas minuta TaxID=111878 RepID=A0AAV7K6U4_9METZ|nr:hypothetical protein LOD99_16288 [Oopsacas minuta]
MGVSGGFTFSAVRTNRVTMYSNLLVKSSVQFVSSAGHGQVRECFSFYFDKKRNILMGDYSAGRIEVFSQEGALLHTLGGSQEVDKRINPFSCLLFSYQRDQNYL